MKVLVTGADGFIGSHLTEALVRAGHDVRAFVFYNSFGSWGWLDSSEPEIRANLDVFAGDIRDPHGVKAAMQGCDAVLHLAALIAIPYSYHSPQSYVETNIIGTLNVLQAARELGVRRVIHTSTSEVYGTARFVPITEDHPLQGQSPYSATKIAADQLALSFHASFGMPVVVARPFNTYGPRQSARAVIPTVISQIAAGRRQIRLGSTTPTRDINFGSNFEISIGETVQVIAQAMGAEVEVVVDEQRLRPEKSEVERLWADNSKMRRLSTWEPRYGGREGFLRGIDETAHWLAQPHNLGNYKPDMYNV
jgi:NAD dependent epimerase/dehydratase